MLLTCCVCKCRSDKEISRSFFRFPSDSTLKTQWLKNIGKPGLLVGFEDRICSIHFTSDCFLPTTPNEGKRLKNQSLPTLYLENVSVETQVIQVEKPKKLVNSNKPDNEQNQTNHITLTVTKDNFSSLCRICLVEDGTIDLFTSDFNGKNLSNIFEYCALEKLSNVEGLPKKVCSSCASQLIGSFIFIKKIRDMQGVLEQIASNFKINTGYNPYQTKIRSNLENILKGYFREVLLSSALEPAKLDLQKILSRRITPYGNNLYGLLKEKKCAKTDTATSEDYEVSELANKPNISAEKFVEMLTNDEPTNDTETPTFVVLNVLPHDENKVKELNKHIKNDHYYVSSEKKPKTQSINRTGRVEGNLCQSEITKIMDDVCQTIQPDDVNANYVSRKRGRRACNWKGREILRMCTDEVKYFQDMITYIKDPKKMTMEILDSETINIDQFNSIETSIESNDLWMYQDGSTIFEKSIMRQLNLDAPQKNRYCKVSVCANPKKLKKPPANKTKLLPKRIECFICNEVFTSEKAIKKHGRETGHPPLLPKFQCKECQLWFSKSTGYKQHQSSHHGEGLSEKCICEVCGLEIRCRSNLKRHMQIHSNEKRFVCETCGVCYSQAYQLKQHNKKKHQGVKDEEQSTICYICGKIIPKGTTLSAHMNKHHSELASHPCDICDQKFLTDFALRTHRRMHFQKGRRSFYDKNPKKELKTVTQNGKKYVTCEICHKTFNKIGFKNHMDIHLNIRRHKCNICNMAFRQVPHLRSHMRLHLDLKPYECDICGKKFRHLTTKVVHRRSHTGETPYVCRFCNKGFAHCSTMKKHEQTHLKDSYELTEVQEVPMVESNVYVSEYEESDDEN